MRSTVMETGHLPYLPLDITLPPEVLNRRRNAISWTCDSDKFAVYINLPRSQVRCVYLRLVLLS